MNSRQLALQVLLDWERGQTHAHDLVEEAARRHRLDHRDAALLQTLVFGVIRNLSLLDHWLEEMCDNDHLEDSIRWVLRLGLAQLLILGMPAHAAVNETVSLGGKARKLVNAVLRRADREKGQLVGELNEMPLHIRHSHPDWLVERWLKDLGPENTAKLCAWNQEPAQNFVRLNFLHPEIANWNSETWSLIHSQFGPTAFREFFTTSPLPRQGLADGWCYAQDPSTSVACDMLAPRPGDSVLDACAAPGGKTAYLAQWMQNQGRLVACDSNPRRISRMQDNLSRLRVTHAETQIHDWTSSSAPAWATDLFDGILVDVPCSNSGVMRRRIDVRWNLEPWSFKDMARVQSQILANAYSVLKPGGRLVYSTCSIDSEENEQVVRSFLQETPSARWLDTRSTLPWRDGVDGAFAALLTRDFS